MCGIAGVFRSDPGAPVERDVLGRMARALAHRGPDDEGLFVGAGIGLASRRLAIQDPSRAGHQPMTTVDGRHTLVFNGEIYNFPSLRRELAATGVTFVSGSDTEVLLAMLAREGESALGRLRGMFAFAFWDRDARRLLLARDRMGKKPLVFARTRRGLSFASEAKAVLQDPEIAREVDPQALHDYLTLGYIPAPRTAFCALEHLSPGHMLVATEDSVRTSRYWTLRCTPQLTGTRPELVEELRTRLVEATRVRLTSDVPVGALLSGGIDSSAVVAAMRQATNGAIRTFSAGFDDARFDERRFAAVVAAHLGTDHVELLIRPDPDSILPALAWHYDSPLADSSAVPTLAVCAEARRHVTVALSGDGGDEVFLGYERYLASRLLGAADALPGWIRRGVAAVAARAPAGPPRTLSYRVRRVLTSAAASPRVRHAGFMTLVDDDTKRVICTPEFLAASGRSAWAGSVGDALEASDAPTFLEAGAYADLTTYLPGALLAKVDIAGMARSLEVRSPLLDHELVEFAARVPLAHKFDRLTQKALLRDAVRPWLPAGVLGRPKAGFNAPLDRWLTGSTGRMARDMLLSPRARARGLFREDAVARLLDEQARGLRPWHAQIWALLVLEWWFRTWVDAPPSLVPPRLPASQGREAAPA